MKLYHLAPMLLEAGSVILPGNFGRLIAHPNRVRDASHRREMMLEQARLERFSAKPSRLNCVFALPNLRSVARFKGIGTNVMSTLYEIEPIEPAETHLACWMIGLIDAGQFDLIDLYWQGFPVDQPKAVVVAAGVRIVPEDERAEVLIRSKCRIIRRLDLDNPV